MEIITKDNIGTKVLKILYRYKLHDSGPDGRGGPSKQFLEYLNAKLIRHQTHPTPVSYTHLTLPTTPYV